MDGMINIPNYNIMMGEQTNKYSIKTLSLQVSFLNSGIKKINYIDVFFEDGTQESYKIGNWLFDVNDFPKEGEYLSAGDKYPLLTKSFDGYELSCRNNSAFDVFIKDVKIELPSVKFSPLTKEIVIKSKSSFDTKLIPNSPYDNNKFYFTKPKIVYIINGEEYSYYPYGVYYGLLNLTTDTINNEIINN